MKKSQKIINLLNFMTLNEFVLLKADSSSKTIQPTS